jgi:cell division protein FtsB
MRHEDHIPGNALARLARRRVAKYVAIALLFAAWMALFDPYGYLPWRRLLAETRALQREKAYYIKKTDDDRRKIDELRGNRDNLEKFAREQYLMKRPGEELFIITDD